MTKQPEADSNAGQNPGPSAHALGNETWHKLLLELTVNERAQRLRDWDASDIKALGTAATSVAFIAGIGGITDGLTELGTVTGLASAVIALLLAIRALRPADVAPIATSDLLKDLWAKELDVRLEALSCLLDGQEAKLTAVLQEKAKFVTWALRSITAGAVSLAIVEGMNVLHDKGILDIVFASGHGG